ncbi:MULTISPECIES: PIN domain-containing protein [Lactiplantibacillus]|uniref:PIN domain-containing protein n=1 Tax=Lactiplantibacillus TaxID=2767842 RepID=UPI001C1FA664|nr:MULTISPECIES: PIN domain-containing protein [Lactiplantibacillus]MBU7448675.1 PIN domain-containing protein [Lactiplantibacillus sp. 7.2.4]MBU7481867.1 PIN domain-containing protein [Lactiplantibacillus pentosus]
MATDINLHTTLLSGNERLLVDTNIWQYIFGIQASQNDHGYSDLLEQLVTKKNPLFINAQIISEYINLTTRLAFKSFKQANHINRNISYKKNYRPTPDFNTNYDLAIESVKSEILPLASLTTANNDKVQESIYDYTMYDFNDEIIINDAISNGLGILTNDKDYFDYPGRIKIYHL